MGWVVAGDRVQEARNAYQRQRFEGTFFELLKLSRELLERFVASGHTVLAVATGRPPAPDRIGAAALDSIAGSIDAQVSRVPQGADPQTRLPRPDQERMFGSPTEAAAELASKFRSFYADRPSAFGPYLRVLYQIFKHIDESGLTPEDRSRFAKIARGQISEGAVFLLALNGMTEKGAGFRRYIENYSLLEHMHEGYRARYQSALLTFYAQSAFLDGSDTYQTNAVTKPSA